MKASSLPFGIIYDIQALQNPLHRDRGIGRYLIDHVDALLDLNAPMSALALNPQHDVPSELPRRWHDSDLVRWNTPQIIRDAQRRFSRVIYHIPSPFEATVPESGVVVRHALRHADVLSVMVFDTIPYLFPEIHQRTDAQRSLFRLRSQLIRRADTVLTISQHTRNDTVTQFQLDPSRVVSHGTGGSEFFVPSTDRPTSVVGPYLLTVSGWGDPRKDPHTTFRAFAKLRAAGDCPQRLVVACSLPDEGLAAWRKEIHDLGLALDDVVFTGRISDAELRSLYTHADVFVLSSRYEGFGLPALEAARCGAPVLTTNVSSLPEVLDFVSGTFDPGDDAALAALIHRAINDQPYRDELREASRRAAQTHVWTTVAARSIAAWRDVATASDRHTRRAERATDQLNVALVGPFPPSKSGIGTFNARVGAALSQRCHVDYFSEGDDPFPPTPPRNYGWFPVQSLGRTVHHGAYDALIYTIGNGHYHRSTFAAALRNPGIVWLHDAHLAGLYLTREGLFLPSGEATPATLERARSHMRERVRALYGPTPILADDDWWIADTYDRQGLTMLREILASARGLIVNTESAAEIARRESPSDLAIHVLPLPFPQPRSPGRVNDSASIPKFVDGANDGSSDTITISTLGWVDPLKRPHDLIVAFSEVCRTTDRSLRLVFVGELSETLRDDLASLAQQVGVAHRLTFTGFTSDADYATWLEHTDIAVQLRSITRGEASAALCDAIAHGIPTITSISTANELPEGVLRVIDSESTPHQIAQEITTLINDLALQTRLATAARSHSASWNFDALAERVLEIARIHSPNQPIAKPSVGSSR